MKEQREHSDPAEAAWESRLAAAWKASAPDADGPAPEDAATTARRLDAALWREQAARRPLRRAAWWAWGAAAACAAVAFWTAVKAGHAPDGSADVAAAAEKPSPAAPVAATADAEETTLAAEREAPVAEAFAGLEEMWTELASLEVGYDWDDEDLEVVD